MVLTCNEVNPEQLQPAAIYCTADNISDGDQEIDDAINRVYE